MRGLTGLAALALVLLLPALKSHGQDDKILHDLMQRKLQQAQKLLEGIAINDLDKVARSAEELIEISKAAEWRVVKTPRYELHSNEFRRIAENVVTAAKEKNLDGAALGYVELTLTCVKCHKYVREVRTTRFDGIERLERSARGLSD